MQLIVQPIATAHFWLLEAAAALDTTLQLKRGLNLIIYS